MKTKIVISALCACFVIVLLPLAAEDSLSKNFKQPLSSWRLSLEDRPEFANADFDDRSWQSIELPQRVNIGQPGTIFWVRTLVEIPSVAPQRLWFSAPNGGLVFEAFADGRYIGSRGTLPPDYSTHTTNYSAFSLQLPPKTARVAIALRCSYLGFTPNIPVFSLMSEASASWVVGVLNFWNVQLFIALAAICFVFCLYSFFVYIFRPKEVFNLYYCLLLGFITIYFGEMGSTYGPFKGMWFRGVAKGGLGLGMSFLVPFVIAFFSLKPKPKLRALSIGVGVLGMVLAVLLSGNEDHLDKFFTLSTIPISIQIVVSFILSLRALRQKKTGALSLIICIGLGAFLSVHDIVYQFAGRFPFMWLQGFAFFGLTVGIFIALSLRQAQMQQELAAFADDTEAKGRTLLSFVDRFKSAGESAAAIALELDTAASAAAVAAESAAAASGQIDVKTREQESMAAATDKLVSDFVESIRRINEKLAEETSNVQKTAAAAIELSAEAEAVAGGIGRAVSFTDNLAKLAADGNKVAEALTLTMANVSASSAGIREIASVVDEFAERTNLLSMNAAIEAAHAGQSGRGFGIIALEIKKLAQAQSERAALITGEAAAIAANVETGAREAKNLSSSLSMIASGAAEIAARISEASASTDEQKRASAEIGASMEFLATSSASIQSEAQKQSNISQNAREAVVSMVAQASDVRQAGADIAAQGQTLLSSVRHLGELAARCRQLTASLGDQGRDVG